MIYRIINLYVLAIATLIYVSLTEDKDALVTGVCSMWALVLADGLEGPSRRRALTKGGTQ